MAEKKKSIGALWVNTGQYGDYLSGQIEIDGKTIKINVYKNDFKKEPKHPDYRIVLKDKPSSEPIRAEDSQDLPF